MARTRAAGHRLRGALFVLALVAVGWWFLRVPGRPANPVSIADATARTGRAESAASDALAVAPPAHGAARSTHGAARSAVDAEHEDEPTPVPAADVPAGFRLEGRLIPAAGRAALAEAHEVVATDELAARRVATSAADGAFAFDGLAPGRYWLRCRSRTDGDASAVVDVAQDTRRDLVLRLRVVVLVRAENFTRSQALTAGLQVIATRERPATSELPQALGGERRARIASYATSSGAMAGVPDECLGALVLEADAPMHANLVRFEQVLETQPILPSQDEVVFRLTPDDPRLALGGLRFRFVDAATSLPIAKTRGMLDGAGFASLACPDGACESARLRPGRWVLTVSAPGYASVQRALQIEAGATLDLGDVRSEPGRSITVTLAGDAIGPERPDLRFEACDELGRRLVESVSLPLHEVGADGVLPFRDLAPGFYRIEVVTDDRPSLAELVRIVDAREMRAQDVRIELVRGQPLVVRPGGEWQPGWRFRVLDRDGVRVATRVLDEPEPTRVVLAPGTYTVELVRGDAEPARVPIVVAHAPVQVDMP